MQRRALQKGDYRLGGDGAAAEEEIVGVVGAQEPSDAAASGELEIHAADITPEMVQSFANHFTDYILSDNPYSRWGMMLAVRIECGPTYICTIFKG
jgi:hypothetical protein